MVITVRFLKSISQVVSVDENTYPIEGDSRTLYDGQDPSKYTYATYGAGDICEIDDALATQWIASGVCEAWTGTVIVDNSVETSHLQDGAVTTNKVANGTITTAKLDAAVLAIPYPRYFVWQRDYFKSDSIPADLGYTAMGNGSCTTDIYTGNLTLTSGNGATIQGWHYHKKFTAGANPVYIWFRVAAMVQGGSASHNYIFLGFQGSDFTPALNSQHCAGFRYNPDGTWVIAWNNAQSTVFTEAITAIVAGDIIGVSLATNSIKWYKNGVEIASKTTNVPSVAMHPNFWCSGDSSSVVGQSATINLMGYRYQL